MANQNGITLNFRNGDFDLRDLMNDLKKDIFINLKCHDIARVESVDVAKQTLKVQLYYPKTKVERDDNLPGPGKYSFVNKKYPILLDVPFVSLRGGAAGLTLPIAPGDDCLLLYNDRGIDDWFATGEPVTLSTNRLHEMSDAIAIVGLSNLNKLLADYDPTRAVLYNGEAKVAVGEKIEIKNAAESLGPVLQDLVAKLNELTSAIAAITVTGVTGGGGVSGPPANAAAITAIGTDLTAIASQLAGVLE